VGKTLDRDVIQALFMRYQREIYLYLYSLSGNREVAEDLTQETFLKAILALPDSHSNIRAWLYKVARNLYFNAARKQGKEVLGLEEEEVQSDTPLDRLLVDERQRILLQAINRLENPFREIVMLQYFGEMQLNQIALLVGVSPGNVRVMASRARKRLKEYMEENGYELS